jgi:hypothetical protein
MSSNQRHLLFFLSFYYLLTALWPLVHISSLMAVTGFKQDEWLVKTVGVLILCISLACLYSLYIEEASRAISLLIVSSSAGLMFIDIYYTLTNVIREIYLVDALIQAFFLCLWFGLRAQNLKRK